MGRRQQMRDAVDEVSMVKSPKQRYFATIAFDYGEQSLDRGQIIDGLRGMPNDAALRGRNYFRPLMPDDTRVQCGRCGAWFNGDANLRGHGAKRHIEVDDLDVQKALELEALREEDRRTSAAPPIKIGPPAEVHGLSSAGAVQNTEQGTEQSAGAPAAT